MMSYQEAEEVVAVDSNENQKTIGFIIAIIVIVLVFFLLLLFISGGIAKPLIHLVTNLKS